MHPTRPLLLLGLETVISLGPTNGQRDLLPVIQGIGQDPSTLLRDHPSPHCYLTAVRLPICEHWMASFIPFIV